MTRSVTLICWRLRYCVNVVDFIREMTSSSLTQCSVTPRKSNTTVSTTEHSILHLLMNGHRIPLRLFENPLHNGKEDWQKAEWRHDSAHFPLITVTGYWSHAMRRVEQWTYWLFGIDTLQNSYREEDWCFWPMVSSTYPEHYLVGVCNEFRSPSAYWPATAIGYCADQTPEVVWPRGPGRQVSRSFPCSTSLHIACPKELEAASRSCKTHLAKNGGGRSAPI